MSVVVAVKGLWLNDFLDPSDALRLPLAPGWSEQSETPGEFLPYAGGRVRLVTRAGVQGGLRPVLRLLTADEVGALQARQGRLQWVRTSTGTRWVGAFLASEPTWVTSAGGHLARVAVELRRVTASDAL